MGDAMVLNEEHLNPTIKCLICASDKVESDVASNLIEQIQLFEQLIGQKTDNKIRMRDVGFCLKCKESLENYKKLKISCIRAWKKRESQREGLVPVIVTPELKLFRIETPESGQAPKNTSSKPTKTPEVQTKPQTQVVKKEEDPLCVKPKMKLNSARSVRFVPYQNSSKSPTPSQALIKINYCYICKSVKSNLKKHLILAHCLYGKDFQKTCNDCGLECNDDESFFRHFEHYHNERIVQKTNIIKKEKDTSLIVGTNAKIIKILPKEITKQEGNTT